MSIASSSASDPVDTVIDILDGAGASVWTNAAPSTVEAWEETTQRGRESESDPALYIWSPIEGTFDEFGAEYSRRDTTETVEIQCWVLGTSESDGRSKASEYAGDVVSILDEYARDNHDRTTWHQIKPVNDSDERAAKTARQTDHYIITVTAELNRLDSTGT